MGAELVDTRSVARGRTTGVAHVDALEDTSELPESKRAVVGDGGDVAARVGRIPRKEIRLGVAKPGSVVGATPRSAWSPSPGSDQ